MLTNMENNNNNILHKQNNSVSTPKNIPKLWNKSFRIYKLRIPLKDEIY